jgi:serine/threonine protein phosphatase 1
MLACPAARTLSPITIMPTWIIGDIHGCSDELAELIDKLNLGPEDTLVSVGDLFHRGPNPIGVLDLFVQAGGVFILGNHELRVLERFRLAPHKTDCSDRPAFCTEFGELEPDDLAGDGRRPFEAVPERRADVLRFLQGHAGFYLENTALAKAGTTKDGRPWCVVHAGLVPGKHPGMCEVEEIVSVRRLPGRGRPYWYEVYSGPNLILFGHTPSKIPRARRVGGNLVALGLDTGCVYGGKLTAYSPELDEFVQVDAKAAYARS